ncbi:hypothetical protein [Streptomyces sp. NPDC058632]
MRPGQGTDPGAYDKIPWTNVQGGGTVVIPHVVVDGIGRWSHAISDII